MPFPSLLISTIEDLDARESLKRVQNYMKSQDLDRCAFKFFEVSIPKAFANYRHPHNLSFTPKDVILTHNLNNVNVTFNYDKFDEQFIDITTSGETTLRMLVGRYS